MKHFNKNKNFRSGLTLIELTIVVALLGFLFTGIFTTYYTALKISNESKEKKGVQKSDILFVMENIQNSFSLIFFNQDQERLIFYGKDFGTEGSRNDIVHFSAAHPNAAITGLAEIREVSFYLKQMEVGGLFHLIQREDDMVDLNPKSGGIEHILLDNVVSFKLQYSRLGDKWVDDWDSKEIKKIPRLIRLELIVKSGQEEVKYEALAFPGILTQ